MITSLAARHSWFEATARARLAGLLDPGSFTEILPPTESEPSPHLALLDLPGAFDDGVVVCYGQLEKKPIYAIAQEGQFMGGAVGEIHGAKIVGMLRRAVEEKPAAVLFLIDSGGVRLHEANAGLIAISEIMRAVLDARAAGVPVIALVGGSCGCLPRGAPSGGLRPEAAGRARRSARVVRLGFAEAPHIGGF